MVADDAHAPAPPACRATTSAPWARPALRRARALSGPSPASQALARGDSLRQAGKYAEAEAAYRAASTLEPTRAEPHFFLGMTTRAADRTDEAMSHYKDALALSPQLAEAHMNVASLLSQMPGREQEALDHYSQALELREWPLELSAQDHRAPLDEHLVRASLGAHALEIRGDPVRARVQASRLLELFQP